MSLCFMSLESNKVFNQLILNELVKEGFDGLSLSLVVIFPYIDEYENISISTLAKKLGYSRQAMHKNIKKLEELDYITLIQRDNKKEKIIKFTEKSKKLMLIANRFIDEVENKVVGLIGKDELAVYTQNQRAIHNLLLDLEK
ncbi:MAG: winged helix-turn-helix transcriptional regulator [Sulfurimonas sp.]|nr:winged helix-turn-helix transcriptional regulator [Sulfurimonas sp.]